PVRASGGGDEADREEADRVRLREVCLQGPNDRSGGAAQAAQRTMRMTFFVLCLAAASLVHAQEADLISADRPGLADGSTTVRRGAFQVELGLERDDENESRTLTTPLLLRYGLTEALELRVETSGWERTTAG